MGEDKNKNGELVAAGVFQRNESGMQELADDDVEHDPNAIPELDKFNAFKDLALQSPAKGIIGTFCDGVLIALERGSYSKTERLRWKEFEDVVDMLPEVARALVTLGEKIDAKEMPNASDIAATIEAYQRASRKTQNAAKRKYLRNALRNAFNQKAYEHGMTIVFFKLMEEMEYQEIKVLVDATDQDPNILRDGYIEEDMERYSLRSHLYQETKKKLPLFYFIENRLKSHGLIVESPQYRPGRTKMAVRAKCILPTPLGSFFVEFIKAEEST